MQLLDDDDDDDESGNGEGRGGRRSGERKKIGQGQDFHGKGTELVPPQLENPGGPDRPQSKRVR